MTIGIAIIGNDNVRLYSENLFCICNGNCKIRVWVWTCIQLMRRRTDRVEFGDGGVFGRWPCVGLCTVGRGREGEMEQQRYVHGWFIYQWVCAHISSLPDAALCGSSSRSPYRTSPRHFLTGERLRVPRWQRQWVLWTHELPSDAFPRAAKHLRYYCAVYEAKTAGRPCTVKPSWGSPLPGSWRLQGDATRLLWLTRSSPKRRVIILRSFLSIRCALRSS